MGSGWRKFTEASMTTSLNRQWDDEDVSHPERSAQAEPSQGSEAPEKLGSALTPAEVQAQQLDDGDCESNYRADERDVAKFDRVLFSAERETFVARFLPTRPELTKLTHSDASYAEILRLARLLHDAGIKPSQCLRALAEFDARIDREVERLHL